MDSLHFFSSPAGGQVLRDPCVGAGLGAGANSIFCTVVSVSLSRDVYATESVLFPSFIN